MFIILLFSVLGNVQSDFCKNYVLGEEVEIECPGECCLDGGSYSITLTKEDVCVQAETLCEEKNNLPTSCPVVISGEQTMYGCGVGEKCCYANRTNELFFEFMPPRAEEICSRDGYCDRYADEYYNTQFHWSDVRDIDAQLCYFAMEDEEEVVMEMEVCPGKHVCCFRNFTFLDHDTVGVCADRTDCKDEQEYVSDTCIYKLFDHQFYTSVSCYNGDKCCAKNYTAGMHPEYRLLCAPDYGLCDWRDSEYDVFYFPHNYGKNGLEAWMIAIIVLIIVLILIFAGLVFIWFVLFKNKSSVAPKENIVLVESPVIEDIVIDERSIKRAEVEENLDGAITNLNNMADLKLAIDMVEHYQFQDELSLKYNKAKLMLEELMRRSEEEKMRELEELERLAEEEKRRLEDAEKVLERKRKEAADRAALLEAQRLRDEANKRWNKLWPRLKILKALNGVNEDAMAKAIEEARKQKEEDNRLRREEEENNKRQENCRKLLEHGISSQREDKLSAAVEMTEKSNFQDELKDLYNKAKQDLEKLRTERLEQEEKLAVEKAKERADALAKLEMLKKALQTGVEKRDIKLLRSAINDVEDLSLQNDMLEEYQRAKDLLARLEKMEKIKKAIMELKRPLIAELKSFSDPPIPVYKAMVASYMLMGEPKSSLEAWNEIVILLNKTGKVSVKRRVQNLEVENITLELAVEAEAVIKGLTSDEVYEANQAASLFFDWTEMICYERKQLSSKL